MIAVKIYCINFFQKSFEIPSVRKWSHLKATGPHDIKPFTCNNTTFSVFFFNEIYICSSQNFSSNMPSLTAYRHMNLKKPHVKILSLKIFLIENECKTE